jgi:hypothetical protein
MNDKSSFGTFLHLNHFLVGSFGLLITARWYGELPSEPALSAAKGRGWHEFLQSPVSGQDFRVTIKLSRWLSPGKRYEVVLFRNNYPDGDAKTMTAERRTAALLTLSGQQDLSWYK